MVTILMTAAKIATLGILKIKVKTFYHVTKKNLSRDSNYIVDVFMWPKFGNSTISMREVIIALIL